MSFFNTVKLAVAGAALSTLGGPFTAPVFLAAAGKWTLALTVTRLLARRAESIGNSRPETFEPGKEGVPARWLIGAAHSIRSRGEEVYREYCDSGDDDFNNRNWDQVFYMSEGTIRDHITRIWIDGSPVDMKNVNNVYVPEDEDSKYSGAIEIRIRGSGGDVQYDTDGTTIIPRTADAYLQGRHDSWGSDRSGEGISYIIVSFKQPDYGNDFSKRVWNTNNPNVEFRTSGILLRNPINGRTRYYENLSIVRYWWDTEIYKRPPAMINRPQLSASISLSDTQRSYAGLPDEYSEYPNSSRLYTWNGRINSTDNPTAIEEQFELAGSGEVVYENGQLYYNWGSERPVTGSIPVEQIAAEGEIMYPSPPIHDRVNTITGSIQQSKYHDFLRFSTGEVKDQDSIDRDGRKYVRNMPDAAYMNDPIQLYRAYTVLLKENRNHRIFEVQMIESSANDPILSRKIGDRIPYSSERLGIVNLPVKIKRKVLSGILIDLTLIHSPDGIYDANLELPPRKPLNLTPPADTTPPPAPTGFTTEFSAVTGSDGTRYTRITFRWNPRSYVAACQVVADDPRFSEIRRAVPNASELSILVLQAGTYTCTMWFVSRAGVISDTVTKDQRVTSVGLAVPKIPLTIGTPLGGVIPLIENSPLPRNSKQFTIVYTRVPVDSTASPAEITEANFWDHPVMPVVFAGTSIANRFGVTHVQALVTGKYFLAAKVIDNDGNESLAYPVGEVVVTVLTGDTVPLVWGYPWPGVLHNFVIAPAAVDGVPVGSLIATQPLCTDPRKAYIGISGYSGGINTGTPALNRSRIDGNHGWVDGPVQAFNAYASVLPSGQNLTYAYHPDVDEEDMDVTNTRGIDLGEAKTLEIRYESSMFKVPGAPAANANTKLICVFLHSLTSNVLTAAGTRMALYTPGTWVRTPQVRYIKPFFLMNPGSVDHAVTTISFYFREV